MNKAIQKVAIVDLVGRGNGAMDYYDLELQKGFQNSGVECKIFSNFSANTQTIKCFVSNRTNAVQKIANYLYGYTYALIRCRLTGFQTVIFHYFQGTIQDLFPYLLARMLGLRTIVIVHDIYSMANNDIAYVRRLILERYSNELIVHNDYSKRALEIVVDKSAMKNVHVIHHGAFVDLTDSKVTRQSAREKLRLDLNSFYILFFGKIKKTKGLDVLLNAMPFINSDVHLIIAGSPWKDDFKKYQSIIDDKQLADRITCNLTYISDQDREYYFKACDALVLPYREIFQSGVLLMALSYALPVVASDLDSNKEIISHESNGMLFKAGDAQDLAERINNLFSDPHKLSSFRDKSFETIASDYNWNKIAKQYIPLLK